MLWQRDDLGSSTDDRYLVAMQRVTEPFGEARDEYTIFGELAARLGFGEKFTEGRTAEQWTRRLYAGLAAQLTARGDHAPTFEEFWQAGELELPAEADPEAWIE